MSNTQLPPRVPGQPDPIAVSYSRFSLKQQGKGDSRRRQLEPTLDWCEETGVALDQSLQFVDAGVSAHRGKNATEAALSEILTLIASGRIWPGCYLVIENLDRLSRQNYRKSRNLVEQILEHGVRIVTHKPPRIYTEDSLDDVMDVLEMMFIFIRANEESETKADRVGAAWARKRQRIAEGHKLTETSPGWLKPKLKGGQLISYDQIPERVAVVKDIFAWTIEGYGYGAIAQKLNASNTPPFCRVKKWGLSQVRDILNGRQVLGEFQPHRTEIEDDKKSRVPDGKPIPNYYPAIVTKKQFALATEAINGRTIPRGPRSQQCRNLFPKLFWDVRDGHQMNVISTGGINSLYLSGSGKIRTGKNASPVIQYHYIETALLACIHQRIDLADVTPRNQKGLSAKIKKASADVNYFKGEVDTIKVQIRKARKARKPTAELTEQLREVEAEHDQAQLNWHGCLRQQASTADTSLGTCKELIKTIKSGKPIPIATRVKLRNLIRQFITRIDVLVIELNGDQRGVVGDITLTSGVKERFIISTGPEVPPEIQQRDLATYAAWPKKWKVRRFYVTTEAQQRAYDLAEEGLTRPKIAAELGVSLSTIDRWFRRLAR